MKLLLIIILAIIPSYVFGKDINLFCKVNKESYYVIKDFKDTTDHPKRYVDVPIDITHYYKINIEDKTFMNLGVDISKIYDLKKRMRTSQNIKIILEQNYWESKNKIRLNFVNININKFTGEFLLEKKLMDKSMLGHPTLYDKIIQKGKCFKSKNIF